MPAGPIPLFKGGWLNLGRRFRSMEQKNKIIVAALAAAYALSPGDSHRPGASAFPDLIQDGDRDYPPAAEVEVQYAEAMAVELAGKADRMHDGLMEMMGYTWEMLGDETAWLGRLDSEGLIDAVTPFIDSMDSDFARLWTI